MSLNRYACCSEMIGEPHADRCEGTRRYPLGRERAAADRYAMQIGRSLDEARGSRYDRRDTE